MCGCDLKRGPEYCNSFRKQIMGSASEIFLLEYGHICMPRPAQKK